MLFNMQYQDGSINTWWNAPQPLEAVLEEEYPEVEHAMMISWNGERLLSRGEENYKKPGVFASKDIFEIFQVDFLKGDKSTALEDKNSIVITESLAELIFGNWQDKQVIGSTLIVEKEDELTITGVVPNPPRNSSIQFDYVIPFELGLDKMPWNKEWGNFNNRMYVMLQEGIELEEFNKKVEFVIRDHREEGEGDDTHAFLFPIEEIYLNNRFEDGHNVGGRIEYVKIFGIVSVFVLILACINFMNLATARSFKRAREVGVRKVVGAGKKSLVFQFIIESIIVTFVALVLAILLTQILLPSFNLLTQKQLVIDYSHPSFWLYGLVFLLVTGMLAGFYPAFVISNFRPVKVLKGSLTTNHNTGIFRKSLVVFQFFLSIFMIAGTLVVHFQTDYIMNRNLGLVKDNILKYNLNQESYKHFEAIRNDVKQLAEVQNVTSSNQNPLNVGSSATGMNWEGKKEGEEIEFSHMWVTYDFVETMGMELVDGRDFSPDLASDSSAFIVNESAVKAMGLENPIGSPFNGFWITEGRIIGVIKDFHSNSIYDAVAPLMVIMDSEPQNLYIRLQDGQTVQALEQIEKIHKKYSPSYPFDYQFLNDDYDNLYRSEKVMSDFSNLFAFLAIVISCLGLIGLASLNIAQKVKEIGVRKVMGASVSNILLLISKDYIRLILLAFVISIPVINYFVTDWLDQFALSRFMCCWLFITETIYWIG